LHCSLVEEKLCRPGPEAGEPGRAWGDFPDPQHSPKRTWGLLVAGKLAPLSFPQKLLAGLMGAGEGSPSRVHGFPGQRPLFPKKGG